MTGTWLGSSCAIELTGFIATGEYSLVDVFVAGHHGLGGEPLLDPGPDHVGVEFAQAMASGSRS